MLLRFSICNYYQHLLYILPGTLVCYEYIVTVKKKKKEEKNTKQNKEFLTYLSWANASILHGLLKGMDSIRCVEKGQYLCWNNLQNMMLLI